MFQRGQFNTGNKNSIKDSDNGSKDSKAVAAAAAPVAAPVAAVGGETARETKCAGSENDSDSGSDNDSDSGSDNDSDSGSDKSNATLTSQRTRGPQVCACCNRRVCAACSTSNCCIDCGAVGCSAGEPRMVWCGMTGCNKAACDDCAGEVFATCDKFDMCEDSYRYYCDDHQETCLTLCEHGTGEKVCPSCREVYRWNC